ncbi:uncharacterized protein TRUGW13939_10686 [Talaromyces rugulosus]|uniref:Uncharacterized protein n=1 Tax=Talaromyces rugulosus TaxID=121627 RepID=A0A7H8RDA9_TALRU|nr:uncharacterized protein TRUGW13939_10686 [Talaromyces rugulosus]QKX63515.1 hypothetical protein TRUGW13939_10686 [Talaromyces rugulosus]
MNKTTAVQLRSGSTSRHKKSQRNSTNSSKPTQRLILHPPKLPQQPKLMLRSSKQSLSNRTVCDWMDVSLVGNGSDASYSYGDICTVQAILKNFNGLSSAPSIIDDVEGKLEDLATSTGSTVDDYTSAEVEMNGILQEALDCHHCDDAINFDPEIMESDIRHGIYRCSEDPPFVLNQPCEDIAPDEMPQEVCAPGYLQLATQAQQDRYLELVGGHINRNRENKIFAGMEEVDQGYESKFAFYCVDYHIHQHYIHRRSALNLCRTNDEMDDFRSWKYKLALWTARQHRPLRLDSHDMVDQLMTHGHNTNANGNVTTTAAIKPMSLATMEGEPNPFATSRSTSPTSSTYSSHSSPSTAASSPPGPSPVRPPSPPILPWHKQEFSISSQITLHRRLTNPRERAARVRAARKQFQNIMKRRALQRREGLVKAEHEAAIAWARWHQGKDAPLAIPRDRDIAQLLQYYGR